MIPGSLPGPDRPVSRQTTDFRRKLVEPWSITWTPEAGTRHKIALPAGVEYNPSAPGVTQSVVPVSRLMVASLPHDVLYVLQGEAEGYVIDTTTGRAPDLPLSRAYADELFRHVLGRCGVARWRQEAAYTAVRLFGWAPWNEEDSITYPDPPYA